MFGPLIFILQGINLFILVLENNKSTRQRLSVEFKFSSVQKNVSAPLLPSSELDYKMNKLTAYREEED